MTTSPTRTRRRADYLRSTLFHRFTLTLLGGLLAVAASANQAQAVDYDQDVTPDILLSGGLDNGSFTVDRSNGIELGLRGKLRFNANGDPENTYNSNGDGTYSFNAGQAPGQGSQTAVWAFEWGANTDFDDGSGYKLDDLTYEMGLDSDPGLGTDFLVFDPITPNPPDVPYFDHAIGDNFTAPGNGQTATSESGYQQLLAAYNVAQTSWRYNFFLNGPLASFDPTIDGRYTIYLEAFHAGVSVARTEIDILVGNAPTPTTLYVAPTGTDGTNQCLVENTPCKTIAHAISQAGNHDTVQVAAGTYQEQVAINKPLWLKGQPGAEIQAPSSPVAYEFPEGPSGTSFEPVVIAFGGSETGGQISGSDVISVDITGFTINGQDRVSASGNIRTAGILLRNVQGEINNNTVVNMFQSLSPDPGRQTAGILVYGDSTVDVVGNDVSGYSRVAISIQGDDDAMPDPSANVEGNTVTGPGGGQDPVWAPNGIQIVFGASGSITNNTISGHRHPDNNYAPGGVVVINSDNVTVEGNDLSDNRSSIQLQNASGTQITNNTVTTSDYGMLIYPGSSDTLIDGNSLDENGYGVLLYGTAGNPTSGTTVTNNTINGSTSAAVGIAGDNTAVPSVDISANQFGDNAAQLDADSGVLSEEAFAAANTFNLNIGLSLTPGVSGSDATIESGWDHFTANLTSDGAIPENIVLWIDVASIDDSDVVGGLTLELWDSGSSSWQHFGWGGTNHWAIGRDAWFLGRGGSQVVGFPVSGGHDEDMYLRLNWPNGTYSATTSLESVDSGDGSGNAGDRTYFTQTDPIVVESTPSDLALSLTNGLPSGSTAPIQDGWAHFSSTLSNSGGDVPENVVLWIEVAGINDNDYANGLALEVWDGSAWQPYGWGGFSSWKIGRDAWFMGRGGNDVVGFPIPANFSDTQALRVNWPDDSYSATISVESLDSADGSGAPGDRLYLNQTESLNVEQFASAALAIAPASHDFGEVVRLETATTSFTVSNTGSSTTSLDLTGISIGGDSQFTTTGNGDCVAGSTTLAGGDSCTIEVSFAPAMAGTFSGSLDVTSDAGAESAVLSGDGILPDWADNFDGAFDEDDWEFFAFDGTAPLYTPATAAINGDYLQINDPVALYAGAYIPRSFGEARVAALVNADGTNTGTSPDNQIDQGVLSHFDPTAQEGYTAYMRMEADYQDLVLAKVDATNFDPALIDERVRIADSSDGDWSMDRMYVVELDVVSQGASEALLIARAFDADTGALLATVEATDAAPFGPGYGGLVAITNATGVNGTFDTASGASSFASASLSDDLVDFGQVEAHSTSAPTTVTISNDGNAELTISDLSLAGTDAAQFAIANDGCTGSVTAGASCTFDVSFSPDGVGTRSAEVLVESNASTSTDVVLLDGEGLARQPTVGVNLNGLLSTYYQGDTESGSEQAQFTYSDPDNTGSIDQIFNVFLMLDSNGSPIADSVYGDLYAGFSSNPADYIRGLSGTSPANVVSPQSIDVDLLFELNTNAPTGTYSALITSYDVTGIAPADVSLDDALGGSYPVLDSDQSSSITIAAANGGISGSVTVNGIEGSPQPGAGVTVTAERDSDGQTFQATATGGSYTISSLPQGSYDVTAVQAGFGVETQSNVELTNGADTVSGIDFDLDSAVTGGFASTVGGTDVQNLTFESGETLNDVALTFMRTDGGDAADFYVSLEVYDADGNAINYTDPNAGIFTAATLANLDIGPGYAQTVGGNATASFLSNATIELGHSADQAASFEYSLIDTRYPTAQGRINHQSTTLAINIEPIGEISGQVNVSGVGGPNVEADGLTVTASRNGNNVASDTTDSSGNYAIEGLSGGSYTVEVESIAAYTQASASVTLQDSTDTVSQDFTLDSSVAGNFTATADGSTIGGRTFAAGREIENVDLSVSRTDGGDTADFYVSLTVLDSGGNAIDYINDGLFTPDTLTALDGVLGPNGSFQLGGSDTHNLLQGVTLELGANADQLDVGTLSFRMFDNRFGNPSKRVVHLFGDYSVTIDPADSLDVSLNGFLSNYGQGDTQFGNEQVQFSYTENAGDIEQVFNVFTVLEGGSEIAPGKYSDIFDSISFNPDQIRGLSGTDPSVITAPGDLSSVDVSFSLAADAPLGDYEVVITSYDVTGIDPNDVSLGDTGSYRELATASQPMSIALPDWADTFDGAFDEADWQFFAFDGSPALYTPATAQIKNNYLQVNDPAALYAGAYIPRSFGEARVAALVNADGTNTGANPDNQIDQGVLGHFDPTAQQGYTAYMRMEADYQELVLAKFAPGDFDPALIDKRVRVADDTDGDWSVDQMYVVELDVVNQGASEALLAARAFDADTGALLATVEATDTAAFGPGYGGLLAITNHTGVNGTFDTASGVSSFASASLSDDLVDFGQVEAHSTSVPTTVTISNDGNAELTISDLSLAGTDASQFTIANDNCSSVAAGTSCTFDVSFIPDGVGARSAEVQIESNASTSTDVVLLDGEGIPAQATVTLSDLVQTYDGNPKSATVTTSPAGLNVTVTYDGGTVLPVVVGTYAVSATIDEPDYAGSTTGTLTIEKADQMITFPAIADKPADSGPFTISASSDSGLLVSFSVASGPATVSGNQVTLTGASPGDTVTITADQAGNANWNAAPSVQQSFDIVVGQADRIEAASATTISGDAGEPVDPADLPTVRVVDSDDNPVPGVTVSFAITSGGGTLTGATQSTDASGEARLGGWTLGNGSTQTLDAAAPGLTGSPVIFSANVPLLEIGPESHDYGNVGVLDDATASFTVTNTGSSSLELTGISISGDSQFTLSGSGNCASGDTLNGGDDCTVEVNFDPDAVASFSAALDITSDAGNVSATLSGTGIQPDWADNFDGAYDEPDWQFFAFDGTPGLYEPDMHGIKDDYLQVNDPDALYAGAYIPRSFGEARVAALVNADGTNTGDSPDNQIDQGVLSHFDPTAQEGYTAYMRMEANYQDLVLAKVDETNFDPALIDERVRVAESSDGDWSMNRMYVVELDVVDQGGSEALLIARAFDADTGALLATVEATDTAPFGPGYGGLVAITNSTGVNGTFDTASAVSSFASASVSDDLVDFGQVEAHSTSTLTTVTISNDGNADLTISDLSLAGADAAEFAIANDNCTGTVSAGTSCSLDVSFSPGGVGSRSAEVRIESNASTSTDLVLLDGEGIPAQATVTLSDLVQTYDGSPKSATVTTSPAGLNVVVTYDSATAAPVNAGSYTVEASVDEPDYSGSTTGTLEIEAADQTIDFPAIADRTVDDSPFTVSATASSGLPVSFIVVSGPATVSGSNQVTLDGTPGQVIIAANQAGDGNWNAAPTVQHSFQVTEGSAASIEAASATTISGQAGQPVAGGDLPTVRVADSQDNPVAGVTVSFAVTSGGGSATGTAQVTDASGIAQVGSWTLGGAATQTLEASAPGLSGNPVVFTANADADYQFAISVDDNRQSIEVGERNSYVIVVSNAGSSDAVGAQVTAQLPPELDAGTADWTCFAGSTATCGGPGTGDLADTADLPSGASVVYILEADVIGGSGGTIDMEAQVTLGGATATGSDSTDVTITEDAIFSDRFEVATGGNGIQLDTARQQIGAWLEMASGVKGGLPPSALLRGVDGDGNDAFRVRVLATDPATDKGPLLRLSLRGADGDWQRSRWYQVSSQERLLAVDYDAARGSLLLAGKQIEASLVTGRPAADVIELIADQAVSIDSID